MLVVGIDVGTSGVRAVAMRPRGERIAASAAVAMPAAVREGTQVAQAPQVWADAFDACVAALNREIDPAGVRAVAIDGTSGTLLVTDAQGRPLADALMYNDASAGNEGARIDAVATPDSAARGAASGLARLLKLGAAHRAAAHALHQADWLAARLHGRFDTSDENNALKTGYDPVARAWPDWVLALLDAAGLPASLLPQVLEPGTAIGRLDAAARARTGWPPECVVAAGTTDGVAAFLATGASELGEGVTSLGSTLVIKQLSAMPLSAPEHGLYSHRLGSFWLPGGASNAGGAALLQHFSEARMAELEPQLQPDRATGLDYYPLPAPGERFPIADPRWPVRVHPRPDDDASFLQGLLEGLAAIEALAYRRLHELGGPRLKGVRSVGGGARNAAFTRIRARVLGVPLLLPRHEDGAAGAARLAARALGIGT